jgi:NCS1 family nucleobase:cation symporter-1
MNHDDFQIKRIDPSLYNTDLAPLAPAKETLNN